MDPQQKQLSRIDGLMRWTAGLALAMLPLVFNPAFIDAFNLPKATLFRITLLVMTALWSWKIHLLKAVTLRRTSLDVPVLLMLAVTVLSTVFSINPFHSFFGQHMYRFEGLLAVMSYVLFFLLAVSALAREDLEKLTPFVVYGSAPVIAYGLLQACGLEFVNWQLSSSARVWSSFGNPNFFAGYLVMVIPLIAARAFEQRGVIRAGLAVLLCLAISALALTYSRAGYIGAVAALAVFSLTAFGRKALPWLAGVLIPVVAGAVLIVTVNARSNPAEIESLRHGENPIARFVQSVGRRIDLNDTSIRARARYMQIAAKLFAGRPLLGTGPDTYAVVWRRHMDQELARLTGERLANPGYAHNEILQVLATTGIAGLAAYLLLMTAAFKAGGRLFRERRYVCAGMLGALAGVLVNNQFSFHSPVTAVLTWFILAYLASYASTGERTLTVPAPAFVRLAGAIVIIAAGAFVLRVYIAEGHFPKGLFFESKMLYDRAIEEYGLAIRGNPWEQTYYQNLGKVYISRAECTPDLAQRADFLEKSAKAYRRHLALVPQDALSWNGLGIALINLADMTNDAGRFREAEQALKNATDHAPYFLEPYINLGSVQYMTGGKEEAFRTYERALQINPYESLIYFNMGNMYAQEDKMEKAIACWQDALDLDPGHAQAKTNLEHAVRGGLAHGGKSGSPADR